VTKAPLDAGGPAEAGRTTRPGRRRPAVLVGPQIERWYTRKARVANQVQTTVKITR
jgi:hypothetical protein